MVNPYNKIENFRTFKMFKSVSFNENGKSNLKTIIELEPDVLTVLLTKICIINDHDSFKLEIICSVTLFKNSN